MDVEHGDVNSSYNAFLIKLEEIFSNFIEMPS